MNTGVITYLFYSSLGLKEHFCYLHVTEILIRHIMPFTYIKIHIGKL